VLVQGINLNILGTYNGLIMQKRKLNEAQSKSNVRNAEDGIFGRSFSIAYNGLGIAEGRDWKDKSFNLAKMPNRITND
jgi:hypothetical protein